MIPRLESAQYLSGCRIRLRFADGRAGEIDLTDELYGEVFEPLKDPSHLRSAKAHLALELGRDSGDRREYSVFCPACAVTGRGMESAG